MAELVQMSCLGANSRGPGMEPTSSTARALLSAMCHEPTHGNCACPLHTALRRVTKQDGDAASCQITLDLAITITNEYYSCCVVREKL